MANFLESRLRTLGEGGSRWRRTRRRTDSQIFREEIGEEQVKVNVINVREFRTEENNQLILGVYGEIAEGVNVSGFYVQELRTEGDNLGIHGDYGEEVNNDQDDCVGKVNLFPVLEHDYAEEANDEEQNQEHEERGNGEVEAGNNNNGSDLVTLSDTDVLDCPICCKPLIIPVFQCGNGHVACTSCCIKLYNICAHCQYHLVFRSRAMERVLESVQAKCKNTKYGCKETMNYSKKQEHENRCLYEPCSCPISDCNFVGSSTQLYQHFDTNHNDFPIRFSYNNIFHIAAKADANCIILQEQKDKVLFIFNNTVVEGFGNALTVSCIASKSDELLLDYELQTRDSWGIHCLKFHSITANTLKLDNRPSPTRYLVVPSDFFSYNGQLELDICIWSLPITHRNVVEGGAAGC